MLPAAKVLLVTVLLGGGAVGTYALAGGKFGPGGSGNGNAETTQTSTPNVAKPAAPAPESTTPPSTESAGADGSAQQRSAAVNDGQDSQSSSQTNNQNNARTPSVDGGSEGEETTLGGKANSESVGGPGVVDKANVPASSSTNTQSAVVDSASDDRGATVGVKAEQTDRGSVVDNVEVSVPGGIQDPSTTSSQGANIGSNDKDTEGTESSGAISPADPNKGNTADKAGSTETNGSDAITVPGGEETRTTSGGEEANTVSSDNAA